MYAADGLYSQRRMRLLSHKSSRVHDGCAVHMRPRRFEAERPSGQRMSFLDSLWALAFALTRSRQRETHWNMRILEDRMYHLLESVTHSNTVPASREKTDHAQATSGGRSCTTRAGIAITHHGRSFQVLGPQTKKIRYDCLQRGLGKTDKQDIRKRKCANTAE